MRTPALCKSLSFKRLSLAMMAGACLSTSLPVMADRPNDSLFVGGSYGLQIRTSCDGATVCDRGTDAGKVFGGYRVTPGWAYEVTYFYLGTQHQAWDGAGGPGGLAVNDVKTTALGLWFRLDTELFGIMTNHLRGGLAGVANKAYKDFTNGTSVVETQRRIIPYVGVGLSMLVAPQFRIQTGIDVLINTDRTNYLATVGGTFEF